MRRFVFASALFALAACSAEPPANTAADINAAAEEAKGDIDTYAANRLQPAAPPSATPVPVPGTPAGPAAAPAPPPPDSAQAAADVVRRYFALIEARKYDAAYRLWGEDGKASGLTKRQFVSSFAKYVGYRAEVGAPGEVDAGAGQRYVEVPVKVAVTLAQDHGPLRLDGAVTLHRVGDVDGASAEDRSWRIRDIALKPRRPETATAAPITAAADCSNATLRVSARNDAASSAEAGRDLLWQPGRGNGRGDAAGCTKNY